MNSRGSRGSARSSASQSATSIVAQTQGARRPSAMAGSAHVSMKLRCSRADRLDVPRGPDAVGDRDSRQFAGVEGEDALRRQVLRAGAPATAARSTSPGASQSPSRRGAKPCPGQGGAQMVAQRALLLGDREGDKRPPAAHRVERVAGRAPGRSPRAAPRRRVRSARRGSPARCGSGRGTRSRRGDRGWPASPGPRCRPRRAR